jgi:hypothetical protein
MRATQRWAWHVSCSGSDASTLHCSSTSWFEVSHLDLTRPQSSEIVPCTELSPEAERLHFAAASGTSGFSTGLTPRHRACTAYFALFG